jgi:hypothetical protein
MKSIWCTVWILGALLVIATLDALPDPPAVVNPSTARCEVLQLHNYSWETAPRRSDSLTTPYPFPVSLVAGDGCEPYRPSDRMVLTVQAADPSPPVPQSRLSSRS